MTMSYRDFQGLVAQVFSDVNEWDGGALYWPHGSEDHYEVTWVQGGKSGGNCWGDSADYIVDPEPEPDLSKLDELLDLVVPRISMRDYKTLVKHVVQESEPRYDYEYYGNYTIYGKKMVQFSDVYERLVEMGLI